VAADFLPKIAAVYAAKGVEMRCDPEALDIIRSLKPGNSLVHGELTEVAGEATAGASLKTATEQDWYEEYLAPIVKHQDCGGCRRSHLAHQPVFIAYTPTPS